MWFPWVWFCLHVKVSIWFFAMKIFESKWRFLNCVFVIKNLIKLVFFVAKKCGSRWCIYSIKSWIFLLWNSKETIHLKIKLHSASCLKINQITLFLLLKSLPNSQFFKFNKIKLFCAYNITFFLLRNDQITFFAQKIKHCLQISIYVKI